ncbi:hypothetical protein MPER_07675 [Moniliophthora perniciosa FA553]|nr:hypothetical protein MPER_07675 [Moniliophthora perniciosa FA553]
MWSSLRKSHSGEYLARELLKVLMEFGIERKILAVAGNNAENNTKMLKELQTLLPSFGGKFAIVGTFVSKRKAISELETFDIQYDIEEEDEEEETEEDGINREREQDDEEIVERVHEEVQEMSENNDVDAVLVVTG